MDSKGVRLDVYVEDENERSFNLEMQISEVDKLEKRMRYYQGLLDLDKLKRGARYKTLGESYIILFKIGENTPASLGGSSSRRSKF